MTEGENPELLFDDGNVDGGGAGRFVHLICHPCRYTAPTPVTYRVQREGEWDDGEESARGEAPKLDASTRALVFALAS